MPSIVPGTSYTQDKDHQILLMQKTIQSYEYRWRSLTQQNHRQQMQIRQLEDIVEKQTKQSIEMEETMKWQQQHIQMLLTCQNQEQPQIAQTATRAKSKSTSRFHEENASANTKGQSLIARPQSQQPASNQTGTMICTHNINDNSNESVVPVHT